MLQYFTKLQDIFLHIYRTSKENKFFKIILTVPSFLYLISYKLRFILYKLNIVKSYKLSAYVISIGNITAGGTGKTPVTIELAKYFLNKGYKVAVLSRGYKRKQTNQKGTILVSDGQELLADFDVSGDEPYLIAKKVPKAIVLVNNDRRGAGISALKLGAEILILDDGFQHLRLKRDENIVLLNSEKPFDNGHLLPKGYLRELPDSIKRATAVLLLNTNGSISSENLNKIKDLITYKDKPLISFSYRIKQLNALNIKKSIGLAEAKSKNMKFIAFSAIANPQSFTDTLKRHGLNILEHIAFEDHHLYNYDDIKKVLQSAQHNKTEDIITTEKDAVKIETLCEASPATFWASEIELVWDTINPFDLILRN